MFSARSWIAAAAAAMLSVAAGAAPVSLGTITHLYGSAAGRLAPTSLQPSAGSCDTLSATWVTVRDTGSGCRRFADTFDFSGLDFDSVTGLTLTLSYASTNNTYLIIFQEAWHVRPALDSLAGSSTMPALTRVGSRGTTSTFTFDDGNLDIFDNAVANRSFSMWFADEALGSNNFALTSASLEVIGTPAAVAVEVPEPGSLALVAAAGLALLVAGRRRA